MMDEEIERLVVSVRADTSGFARDVSAMRGELEGPLVAGAGRAGRMIDSALARAVTTGKLGFDDLKRVALSAMAEIAQASLRALINPSGASGGGIGSSLVSGLSSLVAGLLGAPGRATGGPVSAGRAYVVGERGPELFVPSGGGRIEQVIGGGRDVRVSIAVQTPVPGDDEVPLLAGEVGNISVEGETYSAELHRAAAMLERPVCPATSEQCRAQFGDKHCRIDLAGRSTRARVLTVEGDGLTLDTLFDERVLLGRLRYLTGANTGVATVVTGVDGSEVRVRDLPRIAIQAGCVVEVREGCDKSFATCVDRFANAENFRGEPHLPGTDHLTRYPGV